MNITMTETNKELPKEEYHLKITTMEGDADDTHYINFIFKKGKEDNLHKYILACEIMEKQYPNGKGGDDNYLRLTKTVPKLKKELSKIIVLKERADAADVEAFADTYSFVGDAKAFRLSRTAKNQKDFKVQAMDGWKRDKPYAMVVCPIYQLPNTSSQIYQQATSRNVCVFTYSHLALLLNYSEVEGKIKAQQLLQKIFETIPALNPSKSALDYWLAINRTILSFSPKIEPLWNIEKVVSVESIDDAKNEALTFLAKEREKIMRMSHQEALKELIKVPKIESKIKTINAISDNGSFAIK